jgi:hypothetical protein
VLLQLETVFKGNFLPFALEFMVIAAHRLSPTYGK